jgi:HEAT repeat protein
VLLDALKDRDPQVFEAVAFALGSFKEPRAVAPLIEALSDEEPKNRMSAISALAQIGDKKAVASVMPLLDDKDKDVRRFAVSALEKLTGQHFGDDPAKWRAWWEEQQKVK